MEASEIAHALRERSREKLSQDVLSQSVVNAIANSGTRNADAKAALARLGAQMFVHLPYSRDMELEADAMGMELMARACYDPSDARSLWLKMQAKSVWEGGTSCVLTQATKSGWRRWRRSCRRSRRFISLPLGRAVRG
jgi:predicted Zn-dependent protease